MSGHKTMVYSDKRMKNWELVNFCEFDKFAEKSYCAIHGVDNATITSWEAIENYCDYVP